MAAFARHRKPAVKFILSLFAFTHGFVALLFALAGLMLVFIAARMGYEALAGGLPVESAQVVIEAIGYLAAAVVGLQIAQTIAEEEVIRDAHISAPTRVRRFLSRFFVVVIVALAIEGLVATFNALHENPADLPYAASILVAVGALLASWGVFIHFNREAEELEPEAMEEAKQEDHKLQ